MKLRAIISAFAVIFVVSATAQQAYTLRDCLTTGIKNNYGLQISRNNQAIADNDATRANAGLLPSVSLSGGYTATLSSSESKARVSGVTSSLRNAFNQWAGIGIDINYTLFDGYNNTATYQRLRELANLSATSSRMALEDLTAQIASEYYNLLQQELRLRNYLFSVNLSRERVRIVNARYRVGSSARLDYLQAEVDLNADSAQYINQLQKVADSRIRLNQLMAANNVNAEITTADTVIAPGQMLDLAYLKSSMIALNPQLLMADNQIRISEQEYRQVKSRDYPYVKLNAGYDVAYNAYSKGNNTRSASYGPNVGVTVGINVWDGTRSKRRENASLRIENAKLALEDMRTSLDSELSKMWEMYLNNHRLLALERNNMIVAQENYNIAKERYMLGDLPGIDLREAQKSLLNAQERILVASYNLKISEISLLQISGLIMDYYVAEP